MEHNVVNRQVDVLDICPLQSLYDPQQSQSQVHPLRLELLDLVEELPIQK